LQQQQQQLMLKLLLRLKVEFCCNELESSPSDEGTKSDTAVDDETQPDSTSEEGKPPLRSGLKIIGIDVDAEFLQSLQEHSARC
jgi:hypothetical protein